MARQYTVDFCLEGAPLDTLSRERNFLSGTLKAAFGSSSYPPDEWKSSDWRLFHMIETSPWGSSEAFFSPLKGNK